MNPTRRTFTRALAWTAPVVTLACAAPAYATSHEPDCRVTAECKRPGAGSNTKDYAIRTNCGTDESNITLVEVQQGQAWVEATKQPDGTYLAVGFKDSRSTRTVRITFAGGLVQAYTVQFPPC